MHEQIFCPKCDHAFDGKEFIVLRINDLKSFFSIIAWLRFRPIFSGNSIVDEANTVECPLCGHRFSVPKYKFFGIFSLGAVKILLILFLLAFIAIPFYIICVDFYQ